VQQQHGRRIGPPRLAIGHLDPVDLDATVVRLGRGSRLRQCLCLRQGRAGREARQRERRGARTDEGREMGSVLRSTT